MLKYVGEAVCRTEFIFDLQKKEVIVRMKFILVPVGLLLSVNLVQGQEPTPPSLPPGVVLPGFSSSGKPSNIKDQKPASLPPGVALPGSSGSDFKKLSGNDYDEETIFGGGGAVKPFNSESDSSSDSSSITCQECRPSRPSRTKWVYCYGQWEEVNGA